jgi:hypothetical protein
MLRRLIAWCVPDAALRVRAPEAEMTDVQRVLSPYHEDSVVETAMNLRVIHD